MICAACGTSLPPPVDASATAPPACAACGGDPILAGRYRLLAVLGQGGVATTYRAERLSDGQHVAVKELALRRLDAFKTKDLFHREAQVLRSLAHPGIPRYIDELTAGTGKHMAFYLVQELVEGQSLQAELATRRYTEAEIAALLAEICGILAYLHGLTPPVIHRDLKPSNIMRRAADGRLVLIDFGAVREATSARAEGGSTVAGTFGFMAPEQFAGQASPATDLYALGATAVALLSRRSPQELIDASHELRWREAVQVSPAFARLLADLLQRDVQRRAADANQVAARLWALAQTGAGAGASGAGAGAGAGASGPSAGSTPGFNGGGGGWSANQRRGAAKKLPATEGKPIVGRPSLGEFMRGKVPMAEMIEGLVDGALLGKSGPRPPPDLYRKPPPAPRPSGLLRARKRDATAGFLAIFGAAFATIGTLAGVPLVLSAIFGDLELAGGLIGGGIGGLFAMIGGGLALFGLNRLHKISTLWRSGEEAVGRIEHVERNRSVRVNGKSPWVVTYAYEVFGQTYTGESSSFEPKLRYAQRGQPVAVVFDPNKPEKSVLNLR